MATVGLTVYLLTAQALEPGFTDFWGYLLFQAVATLGLLAAGECMLAEEGGLSWQTHFFAVVCLFADTIGTDGNCTHRSRSTISSHIFSSRRHYVRLAEASACSRARIRAARGANTVLIAIGLGIAVASAGDV